jgi:dTMP kinase
MAVVDDDPAPDQDVRAVLRIRPFRRLWASLVLSSFGDWLGLLATAAMANHLAGGSYTSQNFAVAGVFILRLAPAVVLGPLAGAVADRLDRRWTMVIGDVLRFGLFASIVLVGTLQWLYVATVLVECVALFWGPANDATIPNLVPRRRLETANQLGLVASYGTAPVAAACFSLLALGADGIGALNVGPRYDATAVALWVDAVSFLVCALVVLRLRFPPKGPAGVRSQGLVASIITGWRFVAATPVVRGLVLGMLGAFAAGGFVIGLAQTFVADLGAGQAGFGVMFGAVFVGLATGMWLGPRLLTGLSRRRMFGVALIAAGVCLLGLALVPSMVLAVLLTVLLGSCGGVAWVIGYTLLGLEVEDTVRGRTFAFVQSAARIVLVLVLAAGPAIAAGIGTHAWQVSAGVRLTYNGAAWVFAGAGLLAILMGVVAYRQMDDRRGVSLVADLRHSWHPQAELNRAPERAYSGWFIAFEGGDGSGKSTQARLLADWLRDDQLHEVVLTREPGATPLGVRLREVLLEASTGDGSDGSAASTVTPRAEALLFAADRAHHVAALVRPALQRGEIVVTDRYVDSSIAYQGAGRTLDADEIARISQWATAGLMPDLTVLLDVPLEIARVRRSNDGNRSGDDRLEAAGDQFHERVRLGFLELARRDPQRYLVIDASEPREVIQAQIRRRLRDLVPISSARRAELAARLVAEQDARARRAQAEAEVLRLDAELRGRTRDEARERQEARRRALEDAQRQLARAAAVEPEPPEPEPVEPEAVEARSMVEVEMPVALDVPAPQPAPEVAAPVVPGLAEELFGRRDR